MTTMIIGGKAVNEELCTQLNDLNAKFIALISEIANDVYGDEYEMTEDEWNEFQQDFFAGFVESVLCTIGEVN